MRPSIGVVITARADGNTVEGLTECMAHHLVHWDEKGPRAVPRSVHFRLPRGLPIPRLEIRTLLLPLNARPVNQGQACTGIIAQVLLRLSIGR